MKLHEHEAKAIFRKYGISTPEGYVVQRSGEFASTSTFASTVYPVTIKAQVLVGGRGKAGGIQFASDQQEAKEKIERLLASEIRGFPVQKVLVEQKIAARRELYVGLTIDRGARAPIALVSEEGGISVEEAKHIHRAVVDPLIGLQPHQARSLAGYLGLSEAVRKKLSNILLSLWSVWTDFDAELVEINPLALTDGDGLVALDAVLNVDDDALYRIPFQPSEGSKMERSGIEQEAREAGISFVHLDGEIGVVANGAGLTMATLDTLKARGGRGSCFLDLGGTDDPAKVKKALEIVGKTGSKAILINIFGGLTKCDTIARGMIGAVPQVPVVVRLKGNREAEGSRILAHGGFAVASTLEEAADLAVSAVRTGGDG